MGSPLILLTALREGGITIILVFQMRISVRGAVSDLQLQSVEVRTEIPVWNGLHVEPRDGGLFFFSLFPDQRSNTKLPSTKLVSRQPQLNLPSPFLRMWDPYSGPGHVGGHAHKQGPGLGSWGSVESKMNQPGSGMGIWV